MEKKERLQTVVLGNRKSKNTGRANVTLIFILTQHRQHGAGFWDNNIGSYSIKSQGESIMFLPHWPGPHCYFTFEMLFYKITNNLGRCPDVCQNKSALPCACSLSQVIALLMAACILKHGECLQCLGGDCHLFQYPQPSLAHDSLFLSPNLPDRRLETQPKCNCIWTSRDEWIHLCPSH